MNSTQSQKRKSAFWGQSSDHNPLELLLNEFTQQFKQNILQDPKNEAELKQFCN